MDRSCLADRATVRRIAKPKRCRSEHVGRSHAARRAAYLATLDHGLPAGLNVADLKGTVLPARYREYPKQGNLVLFCPSIGLPSLPGVAPAFLSLTAWLECLRDDAWQLL